jgi:hypothetical protein
LHVDEFDFSTFSASAQQRTSVVDSASGPVTSQGAAADPRALGWLPVSLGALRTLGPLRGGYDYRNSRNEAHSGPMSRVFLHP